MSEEKSKELITDYFNLRRGNKLKHDPNKLKVKKSQLNLSLSNSCPNLNDSVINEIFNDDFFDESTSDDINLNDTIVQNIDLEKKVSGEKEKELEILNYCPGECFKMANLNISQALKFIPSFDGTPSQLHQFIECSDIIFDELKETEHRKFLNLMKKLLISKAYNETVKHINYGSWNDLRDDLIVRYREVRSKIQVSEQLNNCRQKYNEDVKSFGSRIEDLLCQLNDICITETGEGSEKIVESLNANTALVAFQEGLNDRIRTVVKSAHCKTLKDCITAACEEEALLKRRINFENKNNIPKCKNCNKLGHISEKCFKLRNFSNNSNISNSLNSKSNNSESKLPDLKNKSRITCAYCKKIGHHIENCYSRKNKEEKNSNVNDTSVASTSKEMKLVNAKLSNSGNEERLDQLSLNWAVRAKDL